LHALISLDAVRERAYSSRDLGLLATVYAPGPLAVQDAAQLTRVVPVGCGLVGVRTSYSQVAILQDSAEQVVVSAQIALPESVLRCGASDSQTEQQRAAASPPEPVRITLRRTADSYRISAVEPA
jgi:hypothetical protein